MSLSFGLNIFIFIHDYNFFIGYWIDSWLISSSRGFNYTYVCSSFVSSTEDFLWEQCLPGFRWFCSGWCCATWDYPSYWMKSAMTRRSQINFTIKLIWLTLRGSQAYTIMMNLFAMGRLFTNVSIWTLNTLYSVTQDDWIVILLI